MFDNTGFSKIGKYIKNKSLVEYKILATKVHF